MEKKERFIKEVEEADLKDKDRLTQTIFEWMVDFELLRFVIPNGAKVVELAKRGFFVDSNYSSELDLQEILEVYFVIKDLIINSFNQN